jgi:sugar transferase (PEP-CTERM/EpsH1 system associated)
MTATLTETPPFALAAPGGRPLHICHAVLRLDVGGLERVVLDLVREAHLGGHRVSVLCVERPGALAEAAAELGARVVSAGKPPGFRPGIVPRVADLLRELRPDVIHAHQLGALLYTGPAARRAGVRAVVHTEHGKHYADCWRLRLLGRFAARYARRVFAVSDDIRRELRDCGIAPPARLVHVPNGVDADRFDPAVDPAALRREFGLPTGVPVIGTVGRLARLKRQDVLLKGFARLRHPTARLLIVGDGPAREGLVNLAARLGITDRVVFAGYRERPERALGAMDVFTLTSDSEGMPLAVLEAWAAGKPVVASRVGGVPELVADGRTGLLFPAGDEAALASHLDRLLADPPLAAAMGEDGRALVRERYDTRVMADAYVRHYRALLRSSVRV